MENRHEPMPGTPLRALAVASRRTRFTLVIVSRGPSRRGQELTASGAVSNEFLRAADHEADLLAHPYTGVEHPELARLRLTRRDALQRELGVGMPTRR